MHCLSANFRYITAQLKVDVQVEERVEVPLESPAALLQMVSLRLDVIPGAVQVFQCPYQHQNSISCLEPRPFHGGSTVLQEVSYELICI